MSNHISNLDIDTLMSQYGFVWNEESYHYEKGDESVSGDFASAICQRLKDVAN